MGKETAANPAAGLCVASVRLEVAATAGPSQQIHQLEVTHETYALVKPW